MKNRRTGGWGRSLWVLILGPVLLFMLSGCQKTEETGKTEPTGKTEQTGKTEGEGKSVSFTLLLYMVGSDLESVDGAASNDLQEILLANTASPLQILVETGGASSWKNPQIGDRESRRFLIEQGEMKELEKLGLQNMSKGETLSEFLGYARENYPADRYGLILWNHGAGTLMGYGYDENYPERMMPLPELKTALGEGGIHFDFVGFDACLMSTVETAVSLSEHAEYMLASEETEPCSGWYYTDFLKLLSENTAISTEELGRKIVDDFVGADNANYWDFNTLSLLKLSEADGLRKDLGRVLNSAASSPDLEYAELSRTAAKTKSFGEGQYEQLDLLDYLGRLPDSLQGKRELEESAGRMIAYSRSLVEHSCGLAFYYPYRKPESYDRVSAMMQEIGYEKEYFRFYDRFLNTMMTGRMRITGEDPSAGRGGKAYFSESEWYKPEEAEIPESSLLDVNILYTTRQEDGSYLLDLTAEEWGLIADIEMDCFLELGSSLLDLGVDNRYSMNEDGDLRVNFDGSWTTLEGKIVAFYYEYEEKDGRWYSYGYIPATLQDGSHIRIIVVKDEQDPVYGRVVGYRRTTDIAAMEKEEGESLSLPSKGVLPFKEGDEFHCYAFLSDTDGQLLGAQYLSKEPMRWEGELSVGRGDVYEYLSSRADAQERQRILIQFKLTDIYGVSYYAPLELERYSIG